MPHMDGIEATTAIREFERTNKLKSTPIIITGNYTKYERMYT